MRVRVESDAEEELTAADEWYESRRAALGVELVAVIDGALEVIVAAPPPSSTLAAVSAVSDEGRAAKA